MKKLLDKWISISLIKRIIGGLALGIILGLLVPKASGIALFEIGRASCRERV